MSEKTPSPPVAAAMIDTETGAERKSSAAWMLAAWVSFLIWMGHSFAVRAFLDSLHVLSKLLRTR